MRIRRSYSYGCLMVKLPKPLGLEIDKLADSLPEECLFRGNEDAPEGREKDPHITLKYGIVSFEPEEVERVVGVVEPFEVALGRVGVFHNEEYIVLKIGVQSKGLVALNKRVCLLLNTECRYLEYRPHVTIGYLKKDNRDPYYYRSLYDDRLEGESFWVDQIEFSTPAGNRYVIALNGARSKVAKGLMARVDVTVSPMERNVELTDGRKRVTLVGRPADLDKVVKALKWDITKMTRMSLDEAKEFVDGKVEGLRLRMKWSEVRR